MINHVFKVAVRKNAIMIFFIVFLHVKVDAAVAFISIAVVQDFLHELLLLDDVAAGKRFDAWRQHIERSHRFMEPIGIILGHLHGFQLLQPCFLGYFVLAFVGIMLQMPHIGNISHIAHLVAQIAQITEEQVKRYGRTCMTQMGIAINRWAAYIHAHTPFMQGLEKFLSTRKRII